jgi:hypothetical protein
LKKENLNITTINLGGYYIGITETLPDQRWVDLVTIIPILKDKNLTEIWDGLMPGESTTLIDENGNEHLMIELFTAYAILFMNGGSDGSKVANQLYIHYKVLDKLFYTSHAEDLCEAIKARTTKKIVG